MQALAFASALGVKAPKKAEAVDLGVAMREAGLHELFPAVEWPHVNVVSVLAASQIIVLSCFLWFGRPGRWQPR